LTDKEEQPLLNIEEINPRLYEHVPEMQEIKVRYYCEKMKMKPLNY
jgi:hypothetical protein